MKYLVLSLLLAVTAFAGPITQKPFDEFVIYDISVAAKTGTPAEISGLFAKSIAAQEQENAGFLISFTPGNFYFTIRALKKDTENHLTVIFNRKAYALDLTASGKPFYNVTFYLEERLGKGGHRTRTTSLIDGQGEGLPPIAANYPASVSALAKSPCL